MSPCDIALKPMNASSEHQSTKFMKTLLSLKEDIPPTKKDFCILAIITSIFIKYYGVTWFFRIFAFICESCTTKAPRRSFPDNTQCVCPAVPEGKSYLNSDLILTPLTIPKPVLIDKAWSAIY